MDIELDKKYITEVMVRNKIIRVRSKYYCFLMAHGIDTVYMGKKELKLHDFNVHFHKHAHRFKKIISENTFTIHFDKKCNADKFLIMLKRMKI